MKASTFFSAVRHATKGVADIVGDLIEDCEAKHHPLPEVTGAQALK
jgi:HTH-type transcriptional regulator/antitoxin HigA